MHTPDSIKQHSLILKSWKIHHNLWHFSQIAAESFATTLVDETQSRLDKVKINDCTPLDRISQKIESWSYHIFPISEPRIPLAPK